MKQLIILLCVLMSVSTAMSQKSKREKRADELYENYDYDRAVEMYKAVDDLSYDGRRNLGLALKKLNRTGEAEEHLFYVVSAVKVEADDYYNYAEVVRMNGRYSESDQYMEKLFEAYPNDPRAQTWFEKLGVHEQLLVDEGRFTDVTNLDFNSEQSDFGTAFKGDEVVFASSRAGYSPIVRKWNWNDLPFLDLYAAKAKDNQQLKKIEEYSDEVNKKYHDGPAFFSADQEMVFITRNFYDEESEDGVVRLQLLFAAKEGGKWSDPYPLWFNSPDYSVGHASLSKDGQTLYFASDMPGGMGGVDIWKSVKKESGSWAKPENLGNKVNTKGNEMFPFFHEDSLLFFASSGHPGLGGLDNYVARLKTDGTWSDLQNLAVPINGPSDDFAFVLDSAQQKGYFSSNREGGKGNDDIYSFLMKKPIVFDQTIKGKALDEKAKPIAEAEVILMDDQGNIVDTVFTDEAGAYQFTVEPNKKWKVWVSKTSYMDDWAIIDANENADELEVNTSLETYVEPDVIVIQPIYFDFDKWNIRPDAAAQLDRIVDLMNKYPSLKIELGSHTDARGSDEYNEELSRKRAEASARYIQERIQDSTRIYGKGYGETKLLNECMNGVECPDEDHEFNRRTEFLIDEKDINNVQIINLSTMSFDVQ